MSELLRQSIVALLPPGSAWEPKEGGDWDKLLEGAAANYETAHTALAALANVRNPRKTELLPELEREHGTVNDSGITDAVRRQRLAALVYAPSGNATASYMQDRLVEAGFDVVVAPNDPPIDLSTIPGGETVVNGEIRKNVFEYTDRMGSTESRMGNTDGVDFQSRMGDFLFNITQIVYPYPTDRLHDRFMFVVAESVARVLGPTPGFIDGDMELAGVGAEWSAVNSASLFKAVFAPLAHSGTNYMEISNGGPANHGIQQSVTGLSSGDRFNVSAWARTGTLTTTFEIRQNGILRGSKTITATYSQLSVTDLDAADGVDIQFQVVSSSTVLLLDDVVVAASVTTDPHVKGEITGITPVEIITRTPLKDGDMEAAGTDAWTQVGATQVYSKDTTNVFEGLQSMKVQGANAEGFSQVLVVPDDTAIEYLIEGWHRSVDGIPRGQIFRDTGSWIWVSPTHSYGTWLKFNLLWKVHVWGGQVEFLSTGTTSGSDFFNMDDIRAIPIISLLEGGRCESTDLVHWTETGGATLTAETSTAVRHTGFGSFKITNTLGAIGAGVEQTLTATPVEDFFELRFWAKNDTTNERVGVYQNGVLVFEVPDDPGEWQYHTIRLNTADGDEIKFAHTTTSTGIIWVDEIVCFNQVTIPDSGREDELRREILKWKPTRAWGYLFADYV